MGCSGSKERAYPMQMVPQYSYVQEQPMYAAPMQSAMPTSGNGYLASEAFLADWAQFLHAQAPDPFTKSISVDSTVFPVHEAGRDWAEQTLVRMHQDLEGMGIGGDYNYDQSGTEEGGVITIECKTMNHGGPNLTRTMKWTLNYAMAPQMPQSPMGMVGNYPVMPQSPVAGYAPQQYVYAN